jgi:hypothetical protein
MNNLDDNTTNWGIVELMGHKVVAGQISKSEMLGKPMLRIDVPATTAYPEFTQFYGDGSIYCVTFVSEQVARLTAEQTKVNPVSVYVPDLITPERFQETVKQYESRLARARSLPSGQSATEEEPEGDSEIWDEGNEDD